MARAKSPKRSKAKPQVGDVSLTGEVVEAPDVDVDQVEKGSRSDSKRDYQDFVCSTCRRTYTAGFKRSEGPPADRCCGSTVCWALQRWTDDEWRCRAEGAVRRPPLTPGKRLHRRTPGVPLCDCGVGLDSFVVAVLDGGVLDVAVACPQCTTVVGRSFDDPRVIGGWPDRFLDAEALRRFPDVSTPTFEPEPTQAPHAVQQPVDELLCLLISQSPDEWVAGCGRTEKNTKKTARPIDVRMTAAGTQVTCPQCRARDRSGYWQRMEDQAA